MGKTVVFIPEARQHRVAIADYLRRKHNQL